MGRGAAQMETDPPSPAAGAKKRKAAPAPAKAKLVGADNFVRRNPRSDRFGVRRFHHVEFWCGDANTTYRRFAAGLGLTLVAKSDHSTGNTRCGSYVCASGELTFAFTAPYSLANVKAGDAAPLPAYDPAAAHAFVRKHGLAVRAVAQDRDNAGLMGVDVKRVSAYVYGIYTGMTASAGVLIATIYSVNPEVGVRYTLFAFFVAVLAGLGSVGGVLAAGLALGLVESLVGPYIGARYSLLVVFSVLFLVLLVAPKGILGRGI